MNRLARIQTWFSPTKRVGSSATEDWESPVGQWNWMNEVQPETNKEHRWDIVGILFGRCFACASFIPERTLEVGGELYHVMQI